MRLALKFVLIFMLANMALASTFGYLAVRREVASFKHRVAEEAQEVASLVEKDLAAAWHSEGNHGIQKSLERIIQSQPQSTSIRWVWFDSKPDSEFCPSVSAARLVGIIREHAATEIDDSDEADGPNRLYGVTYLHVYWPVALDAGRPGGLEFNHPTTELEAEKRGIILQTALLVGGMTLISGLLAVYLGLCLVGRPLKKLIAKARRMGSGELDGAVSLRTHDELAELAVSLNDMCTNLNEAQMKLHAETSAKITALEQLRHADRLQTVGRLASGIAHELGTPLNVVAGRAGLIASGKLDAEQVAVSAAAIKVEADKMTRIIRQLLDFARASTPHKAPVELRTVVRQTIEMIASIAQKNNVQLTYAPDEEEAVAEIDAGQIQQVLTNLTINAIQAMPSGGQVQFFVRRKAQSPGNGGLLQSEFYAIEVHDQGGGISDDNKQHLFEPFFTTKEVGAGTGLGLSIAYGIVQEHGGWIDVSSRVGEGSCFTVYLPAGAQPPIAQK
jgi:two-component system, NtrC family, sensor kinase